MPINQLYLSKFHYLLILFCFIFLFSCTKPQTGLNGIWESVAPDGKEKFIIELEQKEGVDIVGYITIPYRGRSKIKLKEISLSNDSLFLSHDDFNFEFAGVVQNDNLIGFPNKKNTVSKFARIDIFEKRPQTPIGSKNYYDEDVYFLNSVDKIILGGTLSVPKDDNQAPAIILITGSGQQDRDETIFYHRPFQILADYLAKQGIAVLRIDDRGVGASGGRAYGQTSEDYAQDILSAISFLKKDERIDPQNIGLFGHSEGGIIALLAADQNTTVPYIITYGSPYVTGKELALSQLNTYFRSVSNDEKTIENVLLLYSQIFDTLIATGLANGGKETIEQSFYKWLNTNRNNEEALSFIGFTSERIDDNKARENFLKTAVSPYLHPWMIYILRYSPQNLIEKTETQILAVFGEKDQQVISSKNTAQIEALNNIYVNQIEMRTIKDANHFMQTSNTGSITEVYDLEETISQQILETIGSWVKNYSKN